MFFSRGKTINSRTIGNRQQATERNQSIAR